MRGRELLDNTYVSKNTGCGENRPTGRITSSDPEVFAPRSCVSIDERPGAEYWRRWPAVQLALDLSSASPTSKPRPREYRGRGDRKPRLQRG
jgi:hypothetical protein